MYPRNAASPEPIAIGAVVQISDGAVQTSGCTVRIKPIGVAEGDGAGTTAYSTDGIVLYTPTQAETNYTSFILIAKKTGCIPVSITVVTTASSTPGKVVLSGETHTSAVIPTVSVLTGHTAQTGDSYALANGASGFVATKTVLDTAAADVVNIDGAAMRGTDSAYTGTPPSAATIAAAVEAVILDEGDATALLAAIAAKVEEFLINEGDATATIAAIAAACNSAVVAGTVGSNVAAVKAKTDNLPASPAAVGSQMTLADDAITASKFDESTAFPLKVADSGATAIARTGADSDTLETLSDQIDGVSAGDATSANQTTIINAISAMRGGDSDTLETLSDQLDGLSASSGSGAFTITITVDDGTDPLQNATVRVTEGATTLAVTTDVNGQAVFALDAATWSVAITKAGYQFTPTTLAVSATASQTYSMSAVTITASAVGTVTGYFTALDEAGVAESGVTFTLRQTKTGTAAQAGYDSTARTATSAATTGLTQFTGMIPGAYYKIKRGTGPENEFQVPDAATDPWLMDAVLGSP